MAGPPALQAGASLGFRRRPRDLDQRHGGPAPPGRAYRLSRGRRRHLSLRLGWPVLAFPPGELDAGRFPLLLGEMRRPWRVAETGRFVLVGKLQQ